MSKRNFNARFIDECIQPIISINYQIGFFSLQKREKSLPITGGVLATCCLQFLCLLTQYFLMHIKNFVTSRTCIKYQEKQNNKAFFS